MKKELLMALATLALPLAGTAGADGVHAPNQQGKNMQDHKETRPIGTARMLRDKTIVLDLRAETDKTVGHAEFRYKKDDPKYAEILKHVGGLKPGEEKPVPPFPGK